MESSHSFQLTLSPDDCLQFLEMLGLFSQMRAISGVLVSPGGKAESFFSICLGREFMDLLGANTRTIIFKAELLALVLAFDCGNPSCPPYL